MIIQNMTDLTHFPFDHLSWHMIDRGISDRLIQSRLGHTTDADPAIDQYPAPCACLLPLQKRNFCHHMCPGRNVGIIPAIFYDCTLHCPLTAQNIHNTRMKGNALWRNDIDLFFFSPGQKHIAGRLRRGCRAGACCKSVSQFFFQRPTL